MTPTRSHRLSIRALAFALSVLPVTAIAQQTTVASAPVLGTLPLVHGDSAERARLAELRSGMRDASSVLRSPSVLSDPRSSGEPQRTFGLIGPQLRVATNSAIPFGTNDGPLWAGRGVSSYLLAGFRIETRALRVIIAPELVTAENREFALPPDALHPPPPLPADRSSFGYPFFRGRFTTDLPLRFGAERVTRVFPGQSSVTLQSQRFAAGVATENHWWGPGLRNAIVLSSSAPGFAHAFLRTRRPLRTPLGDVEGRWIVGGLRESDFFDTTSANDLRSFSAFVLALRPWWNPNLALGVARSVYATADEWSDVAASTFDIFRPVTRASELLPGDSLERGRDNILALFARWVLPRNGFEAYAEWARTAGPRSLRDFVQAPNHTHGYTIGVQWYDPPRPDAGALRLQGEITTVEKSPTFRDRPSTAFYVSPVVPQGYTHEGQPVGAFIGPGSSSQWLAADYVTRGWQAGAVVNRIRWHEDVRAELPADVVACVHDVSVLYGPRVSHRGRLGTFGVEAMFGARQNAFLQKTEPCPASAGTGNTSLTLTWVAPIARR